jgi:hypothetical protein
MKDAIRVICRLIVMVAAVFAGFVDHNPQLAGIYICVYFLMRLDHKLIK